MHTVRRLLLALAVVLAAAPADAQPCVTCADESCPETQSYLPKCNEAPAPKACPSGLVVSEDTRGHCCWPGQSWNTRRDACIGVPESCPAGSAVKGEACLPTAAAAPAKPAPALTYCIGGFDEGRTACGAPKIRAQHRWWHLHGRLSDGASCFECWDEEGDDCDLLLASSSRYRKVDEAACRQLASAPLTVQVHVVKGRPVP